MFLLWVPTLVLPLQMLLRAQVMSAHMAVTVYHLYIAGCFPNCTVPAPPNGNIPANFQHTQWSNGGGGGAILGFLVVLLIIRFLFSSKLPTGKGKGK